MLHRIAPGLGILVYALVTTAAVAQIPCTESWAPNLSPVSGPNGGVAAADTFDVGAGPEFFIAGSFTRVAGLPAACCAKFDGTSWSAVGTAQSAGPVLLSALAMTAYDSGSGPKLHVAGLFAVPAVPNPAWHVARRDGTAWTLLGLAANSTIKALKVFDAGSGPVLVAAGQFTNIGGTAASFVARWNGSSWSAMGVNLPTSLSWFGANVLSVADLGSGPVLYAGGTVSSVSVGNGAVAQWNGSAWSPIPSGLATCSALAPWPDCPGGPTLVAAGIYPFFSPAYPTVVEMWNGSSWSHLGYSGPPLIGPVPVVEALRAFDDGGGTALYAGGSLASIGTAPTPAAMVPVSKVARFQNGSWSAAGSFNPYGPGVKTFGLRQLPGIPRIVAGGHFLYSGAYDPKTAYLGQWTGTEWTGLTSGMTDSARVDAMALFDDGGGTRLYAAGNFHMIGSAVANGLARWNGSSWEGIGSASLQPLKIQTMTGFDDGNGPRLYVAGVGATAQSGLNIVRWNSGTSFTPIGFGVLGDVRSLAVWDDGTGPHLWAAGFMPGTGGAPVHLLRWNGTTWESFSQVSGQPNPNNAVEQLIVEPGPGGGLVMRGFFTQVGGHSAGGIARIRPGYVVDALGGGVSGATAVEDATIHDEGTGPRIWVVTTAPDTSENFVYSYGEPGWTLRRTVGPNASNTFIRSVSFQGERALYMGGSIQGPTSWAFYLDRLAYQSWNPVASFEGPPTDLIGWDDGNGFGPFVCGAFPTVAGVPSGGIGHLLQPWPTILTHPASQSVTLGQPVVLQASAAGTPPLSYQWTHDSVPVPGATSSTLTIPSATYADAGYYAVNVSNACGPFTSRTATVSIGACQLDVAQAFGPGVLTVSLTSGPPSAHAFTAFSLLPDNITSPGAGPVFGLHLPLLDAIGQFVTQSPPFVTTLSASGSSLWASVLPPTLLGATVWGVSAIYDPVTLTVLGSPSNISHQFLQ